MVIFTYYGGFHNVYSDMQVFQKHKTLSKEVHCELTCCQSKRTRQQVQIAIYLSFEQFFGLVYKEMDNI